MKKSIIIMAMLSIVLSLCGCGTSSNMEESFPLPQTAEIFLIDRHENHVWGSFDSGLFMDTSGAVYAFDFSMPLQGSHYTTDDQMFEKFNIIRDNTDPVMTIDPDTLSELYSLGSKINPDSKFDSKLVAMDDYGSHTISFRNPYTDRITVCAEYGDADGKLKDSNAKKFVKLYQKALQNISYYYISPLIYTANDIHLNSVECDTEMSGNFFLSSDEQLRILAKQSDTSIDDMLSDYADYEQESYVYFVELNSAPANAIIRTGDSYKLSHTNGSGFCNVAAFPRTSGTFTVESIPCADGGEWQRIKDGDLNYDPDYITGEAYGFSETAMQAVWQEFNMSAFTGLYIPDAAQYEEFIESCDRNNLVEDGSIRSILEENGAPDFKKYSLCIKLDSHNDSSKYVWQRTEVGENCIVMGSMISLNWDDTPGECTLAYVLIPKTYLSNDTYFVSCLDIRWDLK